MTNAEKQRRYRERARENADSVYNAEITLNIHITSVEKIMKGRTGNEINHGDSMYCMGMIQVGLMIATDLESDTLSRWLKASELINFFPN